MIDEQPGAGATPASPGMPLSDSGPYDPIQAMLAVLRNPLQAFLRLPGDRFAWLLPATLVTLLMILPAQTVLRPIYLDQQVHVIQSYLERGVLTEEQAHGALQKMDEQTGQQDLPHLFLQLLLGIAYQIALRYLLPAALLFGGVAFVMRARTRFGTVLSVVAFSSLPAGVREILRTPLRLAQGTLDVYFSPAILTGREGLAGYALDFFDLFDIWILSLLVIGLAATTGMSYQRAAALALPLWVVHSLMKLGLRASPLGAGL